MWKQASKIYLLKLIMLWHYWWQGSHVMGKTINRLINVVHVRMSWIIQIDKLPKMYKDFYITLNCYIRPILLYKINSVFALKSWFKSDCNMTLCTSCIVTLVKTWEHKSINIPEALFYVLTYMFVMVYVAIYCSNLFFSWYQRMRTHPGIQV